MKLREAPEGRTQGNVVSRVVEDASHEASPQPRGGRLASAIDRGLATAYERLGGRYIPAFLVVSLALVAPWFATYAAALHSPHLLPGASRAALLIENYLVVFVTASVGALRAWPAAMKVAEWWRGGRPAAEAEEVWTKLSTMAWRMTSAVVVVGIGLDIIGTLAMAGALRESVAGTAASLLQTTCMTTGIAAASYFLIELLIRPVVLDAASRVPADFRPPERGIPFGAKIFGTLLGVGWTATGTGLWVGSGDEPLENLLGPGLIVSGGCLVFALTVTFLVVRSLRAPMDNLVLMARRAGTGDFAAHAPVTSNDELGELTASFNQMVEDLGRATDALRASRARIVAASDEARRKVERDLHDGAQQHLVLAQLKLGMLERELTDAGRVSEVAGELREELERGLRELRELARGIYPATLESEGLPGALAEAAERAPMPVTTQLEDAGRYPSELEAAVYFCCLEALQNATKHAGRGARATLRLEPRADALRFEVVDDGAGFETNGSITEGGLQYMSDRLGAIGGEVEVRSAPGRGTTVSGRVPLATAAHHRGAAR